MSFFAGEKLRAADMNNASIPVVNSTSDVTSPYAGQVVYSSATGILMLYDGTLWKGAARKPLVHAYTASGASVTNITARSVPLDTNAVDTQGWHSTSVNNTRVIPTIQGYYRCHGGTYWPGTLALNVRFTAEVRANGSTIPGSKYGPNVAGGTQGFVSNATWTEATVFLNGSTDYVELWANQNSGGSVTMDTGSYLIVELAY